MRMDSIKNNSVGFGWNWSTHKMFSADVARRVNRSLSNKMKIDIDFLKESIIEPDLSRKKIEGFIHGHFADIDNLSANPPDAYHLLLRYTKKAIEANKNALYNEREYYKRDKYLGYALHFLQDMLNPFHVVFSSLPKGHLLREAHKRFEKVAENRQNKILENVKLSEYQTDESFFDNILPRAMRQAKKLWQKVDVTDNDCYFDDYCIDKSLENTYITTNAYLEKVAEKFNEDAHFYTPVDNERNIMVA